jgi:hypothetical protein
MSLTPTPPFDDLSRPTFELSFKDPVVIRSPRKIKIWEWWGLKPDALGLIETLTKAEVSVLRENALPPTVPYPSNLADMGAAEQSTWFYFKKTRNGLLIRIRDWRFVPKDPGYAGFAVRWPVEYTKPEASPALFNIDEEF